MSVKVNMQYGGAGNAASNRGRMDMLWSNDSPTSNFSSQTISLFQSIDSYDLVMIMYYFSASSPYLYSRVFPAKYVASSLSSASLPINASGSNRTGGRNFTFDSSTSLSFSSASYNGGTDNSYAIPVNIYGIKL